MNRDLSAIELESMFTVCPGLAGQTRSGDLKTPGFKRPRIEINMKIASDGLVMIEICC